MDQTTPQHTENGARHQRQSPIATPDLVFEQLFRYAADAHFILDDGYFVAYNDAFAQMIGIPNTEPMQELSPGAISPEYQPDGRTSAEKAAEQIATALRTGYHRFEWLHQRMNGETFPVEVALNVATYNGKTVLYGNWRDISDRKQTELERQHLVSVVENSSDFIGIASLAGQGLYLNAAGKRLVGLDNDNDNDSVFESTKVIDYFPPEEQVRVVQEIWPVVMRDGRWKGECLFRNFTTGELIPVEWNVFFSYDERTGEPIAMLTVTRDLREQKRQEAERAALQEQIIDAQRDTLRALSTPLIPISNEVVIMPLIGTIDSRRAQQVLETLLEGVTRYQANLAIIDITGVALVDTQVAQALISAAQAVKLLGSQVMLTGIQPQIAQTLVQLEVDLGNFITQGSLQAGIALALGRNAISRRW